MGARREHEWGAGSPERGCAAVLIDLALREDLGDGGDLTTKATIPPDARGSSRVVSRGAGVAAGLPIVPLILERAGSSLAWEPLVADGDRVGKGTALGRLSGPRGELLILERTILNFLTRLGGIATLTARFVEEASGTKAVILDTRKTTPGWRILEKYAVRCGGGRNHRIGLYDMVLIKDNHLAALAAAGHDDPIGEAIRSARKTAPGIPIELEVDTLAQLERALGEGPDIVLVDNFGPSELAEAIRLRDGRNPSVLLEVSGGVRLETVAELARTGVDRISAGALTHSAPALDIGLDEEVG